MERPGAGDLELAGGYRPTFLILPPARWLVDDLTVDLERRPEPADRTKAIPLPRAGVAVAREDVGLREKALWRLLYETAAR
jgi:hypothetical protein